jgi:acyl-CoA thioesterase YciA
MKESALAASSWSNMPEISSEDALSIVSGIAPLQLPNDRQLVMRTMPMPADANSNGDIFGGWIMAQVDIAGAVLPARIAKGRIATVAVNQFVFKQPVSMGDLLSFYARVERIGNTSVTVNVEVYAERNPADLHVVKVTEANLTYVAIDMNGRPRPIPKG